MKSEGPGGPDRGRSRNKSGPAASYLESRRLEDRSGELSKPAQATTTFHSSLREGQTRQSARWKRCSFGRIVWTDAVIGWDSDLEGQSFPGLSEQSEHRRLRSVSTRAGPRSSADADGRDPATRIHFAHDRSLTSMPPSHNLACRIWWWNSRIGSPDKLKCHWLCFPCITVSMKSETELLTRRPPRDLPGGPHTHVEPRDAPGSIVRPPRPLGAEANSAPGTSGDIGPATRARTSPASRKRRAISASATRLIADR